MKYLLLILLSFMLTVTTTAQQTDSIEFVSARWKVQKLKRGIHLYEQHFNGSNLFHSNQYISYVILKNKKRHKKLNIAAEPRQLKTTSELARAKRAVAAINGNFFDVKNGGAVGYVKVDNNIVNTNRIAKNKELAFHQKAAVVIDRGRLSIKKWNGENDWAAAITAPTVMVNGPLLMLKQQLETLDSSSFTTARHPRTCVGITKNNQIIMLVADGRSPNAAGMNLPELRKIMRWLGCIDAINFDGGGSSTLWVKGRGVVNYPSDNKKWDHDGERKVANILYVK